MTDKSGIDLEELRKRILDAFCAAFARIHPNQDIPRENIQRHLAGIDDTDGLVAFAHDASTLYFSEGDEAGSDEAEDFINTVESESSFMTSEEEAESEVEEQTDVEPTEPTEPDASVDQPDGGVETDTTPVETPVEEQVNSEPTEPTEPDASVDQPDSGVETDTTPVETPVEEQTDVEPEAPSSENSGDIIDDADLNLPDEGEDLEFEGEELGSEGEVIEPDASGETGNGTDSDGETGNETDADAAAREAREAAERARRRKITIAAAAEKAKADAIATAYADATEKKINQQRILDAAAAKSALAASEATAQANADAAAAITLQNNIVRQKQGTVNKQRNGGVALPSNSKKTAFDNDTTPPFPQTKLTKYS